MITDTSLESYIQDEEKREYMADKVYDLVCHIIQPSSADIARIGKMPRTSVTGRLRELEQAERIVKAGKKKDHRTGKTVYWYAPTGKVV